MKFFKSIFIISIAATLLPLGLSLHAMEKEDQNSAIQTTSTTTLRDRNCMLSWLPVELFQELDKFCIGTGNGRDFWLLQQQKQERFMPLPFILPWNINANPEQLIYHPRPVCITDSNHNRLVFLAHGNDIGIYNLATRKSTLLQEHSNFITCLAYDKGNNHLFSASQDHSIKVWNLHTNTCIHTISDFENTTICFAIDEKYNRLFAGGVRGAIKVWNTQTFGLEQEIIAAHSAPIKNLIYNPETNLLYSGCKQGFIKIWNTKNALCFNKILGGLPKEPFGIDLMALDIPNQYLYTGAQDKLKLWDLKTGICIQEIVANTYNALALILDSGRNRIIIFSPIINLSEGYNPLLMKLEIFDLKEKVCVLSELVDDVINFEAAKNELLVRRNNSLEVWHLEDAKTKEYLNNFPLEDHIKHTEFFDSAYNCCIHEKALDLTQADSASLLEAFNQLPAALQHVLTPKYVIVPSPVVPQESPLANRLARWKAWILNK